MSYRIVFTIVSISLLFALAPNAQAQKLQTIFGNTAYGAVNGAALGAATMALRNSSKSSPITFGIGAGILAGAGVGAYDLAYNANSASINGVFNSVPLTGTIILLDTAYGAGAGALVGMAFSLMGAADFVDGLRVGAGIGAWGGFAFGLADAFYFSPQNQEDYFEVTGYQPGVSPYTPASGFLTLHNSANSSLSMINPIMVENNHPGYESRSFGVELMRFHIRL